MIKSDKFMDAVGLIDDELIAEAITETSERKHISKKVIISLVAALIIFFAFGITTAAKEFNFNLDWVLYDTFSYVAERLKPVNLSCEDNGIKMEIISAKKEGKKAYIYISMEDLEGNRIDETIDLYDSVILNLPHGFSGSCTKIGYDESSRKATFLISINQNKGINIPFRKVSFSVGCFLSGRTEPEGFIEEIDLSKAKLNPEYETETTGYKRLKDKYEPGSLQNKIYWFAYERIPRAIQNMLNLNDGYFEYEVYDEETEKYLSDIGKAFYISETGAEFFAMGFIDDKLHIKVYYGTRHYNDHIGFLTIFNENGKEIHASKMKYISNFGEIEPNLTAPLETWVDYTFDISPEEIEGCHLYARFWKYQNYVEGDWQIRFRIP
ncbi:MAG: DUF4179 domain-containing protein [Oscillospiraceae bacterium]|nr:DUF4179 domain-containing protein [Oscillospiraceae bacterium]